MNNLNDFENIIGYRFNDIGLLKLALSHSSYVNELTVKNKTDCNERIEFLGDAVLEIVSSEYLYKNYPNDKEGVLSKHRAGLVCEKSLAGAARKLEFGKYLMLGKGERTSGGAERDSILADAFEAVIGAMYLDGGLDIASAFILKYVLEPDTERFVDYKSKFQELVQSGEGEKIIYELEDEYGPAHEREFVVGLYLDGTRVGTGKGHNKKMAEQMAAREAIDSFLNKH